MIIKLKYGRFNAINVKVGFSWTTLLFGWLVPLSRLDLKYMFIMLVLEGLLFPLHMLTFGISALIIRLYFVNNYNRLFIKKLLKNGYIPNDSDIAILISEGIIDNDVIYNSNSYREVQVGIYPKIEANKMIRQYNKTHNKDITYMISETYDSTQCKVIKYIKYDY